MFIDCSRTIINNMPAFRLKNEDGTYNEYKVKIEPFFTREQTKLNFVDNVSFEITQITLQCAVGTYLDSPYHRYEGMNSIEDISISDTVGEGIIIDARGLKAWEEFDNLDRIKFYDIKNKIVLINFGWDKHFGNEEYHAYPFISEKIIKHLVKNKPKVVGVDTINIDSSKNLSRPAHSILLKDNILIVENLVNLDKLHHKKFKFYSVPVKIESCTSFPVRAFAEIYP